MNALGELFRIVRSVGWSSAGSQLVIVVRWIVKLSSSQAISALTVCEAINHVNGLLLVMRSFKSFSCTFLASNVFFFAPRLAFGPVNCELCVLSSNQMCETVHRFVFHFPIRLLGNALHRSVVSSFQNKQRIFAFHSFFFFARIRQLTDGSQWVYDFGKWNRSAGFRFVSFVFVGSISKESHHFRMVLVVDANVCDFVCVYLSEWMKNCFLKITDPLHVEGCLEKRQTIRFRWNWQIFVWHENASKSIHVIAMKYTDLHHCRVLRQPLFRISSKCGRQN